MKFRKIMLVITTVRTQKIQNIIFSGLDNSVDASIAAKSPIDNLRVHRNSPTCSPIASYSVASSSNSSSSSKTRIS